MKKLILAMAMSLASVAFANEEYSTTLDMTENLFDANVDMFEHEPYVTVLLKDEGSTPEVIQDPKNLKELSQCLGIEISTVKRNGIYEVTLLPDFNLDDGMNLCRVLVKQPSGQTAEIGVYLDIRD